MTRPEEQFLTAELRFQQKYLRGLSDPTRKRLRYDNPYDHPHVRALSDTVARQCARLRGLYEVSQGRFARNFQEVHAPNSTAPVPGFAILAFLPKEDGEPFDLLRGFDVHPVGHRGVPFRTTAALRVRPVSVTAVAVGRAGTWADLPRAAAPAETVLRFTLTTTHPDGFAGLDGSEPFSLHLAGEGADPLPYELYEALFADRLGVWARDPRTDHWFEVDVTPGGLSADEPLLGERRDEPTGERRLRDFFAFHPKFLFADFRGLGPAARAARETIEVAVGFRRPRPGLQAVRPPHLITNAVPAVNLRELPLDSVPAGALTCEVNVTRALDAPSAGTDVYAVRKVQVDATEVPHLMLGRAVREPAPGGLRWHAERFPATAANPLGRVTLRLLDPALEAADLGGRVFHLTVDVTNRSLSPDVRGVRDYEEMSCNGIRATAVRLPTPVLHPKPDAGGGALTLATLNSLALGGRANAGRMLAGVLAAFALLDAECDDADPDEQDRQAFAKSLLSGLTEVGVEPDEDWDRGWVSGRHYRVRLSHAANRPGSGFLLGTVLESVLAGFAGWDAFVRTTVTTPTATHTFPAQIGEEDL